MMLFSGHRWRALSWGLLLSMLLLVALSPVSAAPNPVVYPPYQARIVAAHAVHAQRSPLGCFDCHEDAATSRQSRDWLGPSVGRCTPCHGAVHAATGPGDQARFKLAGCASCHRQAEPGRTLAPAAPHLLHSHERHILAGIGCVSCHSDVASQADARGSERLPSKPVCMTCHGASLDGRRGPTGRCTACHESERGLVRTRFREGWLTPPDWMGEMGHGPGWLYRHGEVAGNNSRLCNSCHRESDCTSCHDGRLRPRAVHPNDWLSLHGVAARQEGPSCNSCHRAQSFCQSCHQRLGLVTQGPLSAMARRGSVHPPRAIWVDGPRSSQHHGTLARRNLSECVACHQERDCIGCHASAGVRGPGSGRGAVHSPHPAGFAAVCRQAFSANPRPCLSCHAPDAWELRPCQ